MNGWHPEILIRLGTGIASKQMTNLSNLMIVFTHRQFQCWKLDEVLGGTE